MSMKSILAASAALSLIASAAGAQQATFPAAGGGVSTPVSVPQGGSGNTSLATGAINSGNGTGAYVPVSPGASGTVLTSNGSGVAPSYQSPSAGTGRLAKLGFVASVNFAATGDTAFAISLSTKYVISQYIVTNCTTPPAAAVGSFYSTTGGGGSGYFSTTTYTAATVPSAALILQAFGAGNSSGTRSYILTGPTTVYFHISTANVAALTCDVILMGEDVS